MPPDSETFFETLARERPDMAAKYMGHLAKMILSDCPGNVRMQIISAKVNRDPAEISKAQNRNSDLRNKFMELSTAFFSENFILGNLVDHGSARYIGDVIYEERQGFPLS